MKIKKNSIDIFICLTSIVLSFASIFFIPILHNIEINLYNTSYVKEERIFGGENLLPFTNLMIGLLILSLRKTDYLFFRKGPIISFMVIFILTLFISLSTVYVF